MSQDIRERVYRNFVPPFVACELDRLYENIFSSLSFLTIYGLDCAPHTYVASRNGKTIAVLLFECDKNRVHVFNEGLHIGATEVERFASHIFSRYPSVELISFNAIRTDLRRLHRPLQRFNCVEDIVVQLPKNTDEYTASLGKATRKNIKRYLGKLKRDFPSLQHEVYACENIREEHVRNIFLFNKARLAGKNKVSSYDEEEILRTIRLARICGLASIITIDGKICAGEICTQAGMHYFSHIGAHDPRFDAYRLGTLSCYLCICECIRRKGKEFHFLWGQYEYKYMLAGVRRDLDHLTIYRSRIHICLNGRTALRNAAKAMIRKIRSAASGSTNRYENGALASPVMSAAWKRLRNAKRSLSGALQRNKAQPPTQAQAMDGCTEESVA